LTAALHVLSPGLLTTVQDLGRFGYAHLGVSASGPADSLSAISSNRLVGNGDNYSVLEMALLGGRFEVGCDSTIAVTGADFAPALDGRPLPLYEAVRVHAGSVLSFGSSATGARCYLAIAGGLEIPAVLGSTSTHVTSRTGGFAGRALVKGDTLPLKAGATPRSRRVDPLLMLQLGNRKLLRVTLGPQHASFGEDGQKTLCSQAYIVSEDSNRLGIRLHGNAIAPIQDANMLTEGVSLGAIQVPPGGSPIILFVEHQTTGGYPKIANVINADLPSVGQLRPRDEIRFEVVTIQQAIELLKVQEEILNRILPPA
jgi:antagonist of KipI